MKMICLPNYIRVIQVRGQKDEYTLFNSKTGDEYIIDDITYKILKELSEKLQVSDIDCKAIIQKNACNYEEIYEFLVSEGIIITKCEDMSFDTCRNILPPKEIEYPLTTITIELTNVCSLNCIHCYGAFGKNVKIQEYTLNDIKELKKEFDILHVQSVVLTGGDLFMNSNSTDIALFFLKNGFKVSILANGWKDMNDFYEAIKEFQVSIIFSLDGLEETHDFIRGRKGSYEHIMNAIKKANMYDKISIGISTTIMKKNILEIEKMQNNMKKLFPNISMNQGLIIPVGDEKQSFKIDEMEDVYDKCPSAISGFIMEEERKERCQGGISICSLTAEGNVLICAAARGKQFTLGNIYKRKLSDIWINPPTYIKKYRMEKHLSKEKCKMCGNKEICKKIKDCRIYADKYSQDEQDANPICCLLAEKIRNKES